MRQFMRCLVRSGWSKRLAGVFVTYGITWEWSILGTDGLPDYSLHALRYFRSYLRRIYPDVAALSQAWGREVTFELAEIPDARRRTRSGGDSELRRLPDEQGIIDHQQSLSEMNVDWLLRLCRSVKEESGGHANTGTFYGYTPTAREQTDFYGTLRCGRFLGRASRAHEAPALA